MKEPSTLRELDERQPVPRVPDHELIRCIGRGSYGEVWLARNTLGTMRAVKVVFRGNFEEDRPYEREYMGIRKYEPVSRSHDGLVDILQVGRNDAEGYFYYVMELADPLSATARPRTAALESDDVQDYSPLTLRALQKQRGRLPAGEVVGVGLALAEALEQLHRSGLIHRDIKPANIIFVGGVAKLADIGLVTDASEPGTYVGTEGFIPPEGPNSPQADLYSLGKVLYEIGMGRDRLDFPEPPTELKELPDRPQLLELNSVLLKACQPERRQRYASAAEMRADLLLIQRGRSVREKRSSERRLRWSVAAGIGLVGLTLGALGIERMLDREAKALQGQSGNIHPSLAGRITPRDASWPGELIDLSAAYTAPLTERWYPGPVENTLSSLPRGRQAFGHTSFDVRGLVQLSGGEISSYGADLYPVRVRDIWVERWVDRLHFLHGTVSEVVNGLTIGSYRIYYATGRSLDVPLIYGENIEALWQPRERARQPSRGTVAWRGQNPATEPRELELRLYQFTWENPWPKEEVVAIDFTSAMTHAAPFLAALTVDDAILAEGEKVGAVNLVEVLQEAAPGFREIEPLTGTAPFAWSNWAANVNPIEVGGRFYDGFRFTLPAGANHDLVWAFAPQKNPFHGWFILPLTGGLKVGFEDWYHVTALARDGEAAGADFVVQFLDGKKLQPGCEYFIWFGSDSEWPVELQVAMRLVPARTVNPNQPADLVVALGIPAGELQFHRHYCLGAIR